MIDVDMLVPEARPIVQRVARVYYEHLRPWFIGLLVHGSALKGGLIPGCSDIDLQLFLADAAFDSAGHLPVDLLCAIHRDLAPIDPAPFGYIQCYPLAPGGMVGSVGPIPGTYAMIMGERAVPEATPEQVFAAAHQSLANLDPQRDYIPSGLLQTGGERLERAVRLLCTDVSPTLYNVLTLREQSLSVWVLPRHAAVQRLPEREPMWHAARRFYQNVTAYYGDRGNPERAYASLARGVEFLHAAKEWYAAECAPVDRKKQGPHKPA